LLPLQNLQTRSGDQQVSYFPTMARIMSVPVTRVGCTCHVVGQLVIQSD